MFLTPQQIIDQCVNDPFLHDIVVSTIDEDIGTAAVILADTPEEFEALKSYRLVGDDDLPEFDEAEVWMRSRGYVLG